MNHAGDNDLCPPSPSQNDCKEHCRDYKIVLDTASAECTELQILFHYEGCEGQPGIDSLYCYKAYKDPDKTKPVDSICRCCGNGDGQTNFECAKHGFASAGFMKEVRQNNHVYKEYSGELAYYEKNGGDCRHTKVGDDDKKTCCTDGYWAEYDPSTEIITIGCL